MARFPVDLKRVDRFAELVGSGLLTQHEAARAVGISERQGERLLTRPEVRAKVEDARRKSPASVAQDARALIEHLVQAVQGPGGVIRARAGHPLAPESSAPASEQRAVARWAFKTALMIDRASERKYWVVPETDFRYLFLHREPPASVSIHLARYVPDTGEEIRLAWTGSSWAVGELPGGKEIDGYRVTFNVGHAIFQLYGHLVPDGHTFVAPLLKHAGKPVQDAFRRLWPLTGAPHEWPPREAHFNTSGLELLEPPLR